MTTPPRWTRLVSDLAAAGVATTLVERPWQQVSYGRLEQGVSRKVILLLAGGGTVEIHDKYGRGGKWYGWNVFTTDSESIVVRDYPNTKNRAEVVAHVTKVVL